MTTGLTDRHRALLDERSASLATRGLERRRRGLRQNFLVCQCGRERFGLSINAAASVLPGRPCTPVPGTNEAFRGIICHSGTIISVIDLARALRIERHEQSDAGHFVRLRALQPPIALAVDRVIGVARIAVSDIESRAGSENGHDRPEGMPLDEEAARDTELGSDPILGYVAPGLAHPSGVTDGFSVIDLPRLLRLLL